MHASNEDDERQRQAQERSRLSLLDRLTGRRPRTTASGFEDMRSKRRTGRIVQMQIRLHPRVKAMIDAIMQRDNHPSMVAFFEEMLDAYQQIHGPIDQAMLPSEEDLIRRIEEERDKRDG